MARSGQHRWRGGVRGPRGAVRKNVAREPDPANFPRGLFNLDVHIHDVDSGHPVPYLDVRADVSRNGAAVLTGLEMVLAPQGGGGTALRRQRRIRGSRPLPGRGHHCGLAADRHRR